PRFEDCHLRRARQDAAKAELLVVNHHLFLADMALRETGFGEVLPGAEAVIFDEAHLLPEIAPRFFGQALGSRQLEELARDVRLARIAEAPELLLLDALGDGLVGALRAFRLSLGAEPRRGTWADEAGRGETASALRALGEALGALDQALKAHAERGENLEACARRAALQGQLLQGFASPGEARETEDGAGEWVEWFETTRRGFHLYRTPVEVGAQFSRHRDSLQCAWVFTSATLAVSGRFDHFQRRLGLDGADTACWDSPFDYASQALLYLPGLKVDPGNPAYTREVVRVCREVLPLSRGRAFVLFTSHRALQEAAELLRDTLPWPLLVQGEAPRPRLLQRFRELGDAVLLGTSSFWEGVDVRGEALSCVIIDKLPFAAPDDPVLQARLQLLRREGGNPFMDHQLPEAVLLLKQGAGRLIRDPADRGLLVLCDPRLGSRPYGRHFLASLPPMPRTGSLAEVEAFFDREVVASGQAGPPPEGSTGKRDSSPAGPDPDQTGEDNPIPTPRRESCNGS
ncbi:MAG: ATP-dependent DNA helicase, partial [Gammaproteobacteria bacterium]